MQGQTTPFNFERDNWFRFQSCRINEQGEVVPEESSVPPPKNWYRPLDYYLTPVPEEIVQDILGKRAMGALERPFYLHTLFASLNPENTRELLAFVNHFGIPYFMDRVAEYEMELADIYVNMILLDEDLSPLEHSKVLINNIAKWLTEKGMPRDKAQSLTGSLLSRPQVKRGRFLELPFRAMVRGIPLKTLAAEVDLFRWVTEIAVAYTSENREKLEELLSYGENRAATWAEHTFAGNELGGEFFMPFQPDDSVFLQAADVLETIIRPHLRRVRPTLIAGTFEEYATYQAQGLLGERPFSLAFGWEFGSLLSTLYLMLFLDLTGGKLLRRCSNPLCGRFFVAARANNQYCSTVCQNRAKQQRFKRRHKGVAATVAATREEKHENDR